MAEKWQGLIAVVLDSTSVPVVLDQSQSQERGMWPRNGKGSEAAIAAADLAWIAAATAPACASTSARGGVQGGSASVGSKRHLRYQRARRLRPGTTRQAAFVRFFVQGLMRETTVMADGATAKTNLST